MKRTKIFFHLFGVCSLVCCMSFLSFSEESQSADKLSLGLSSKLYSQDISKNLVLYRGWEKSKGKEWGLFLSLPLGKFSMKESYQSSVLVKEEVQMVLAGLTWTKGVPVRKNSLPDFLYISGGLGSMKSNSNGEVHDRTFIFLEPGLMSLHKITERSSFAWRWGVFFPLSQESNDQSGSIYPYSTPKDLGAFNVEAYWMYSL